jgi:hypothetical protein
MGQAELLLESPVATLACTFFNSIEQPEEKSLHR